MPWQLILPRAVTLLGIVCLATFEWGEVETLQMAAGAAALWGPFAAIFFMWLQRAVPDRGERLALALTAGYATTALLYFALAVFRAGWLFPGLQIAAIASLATIRSWRRQVIVSFENWRDWKCDWWLAAIIVATLLVSVRYRVAFDFSPVEGTRHFRLYHDQTYHTALAYELQRHVPPLQQPTQAGTPDRAYHLFPHVSTELLARYAGHSDLLHVQTTWSFVVMTVLICLSLHYLVRNVAGSNDAGYCAVALLFILSIPFPPLIDNPLGYFYFSLYPHATSLLEPVVMTTPQMYSGLVVFFGILLGLAICSKLTRRGAGGHLASQLVAVCPTTEMWRIVALLGLMTGALLRFRAHIFLPFAPWFGLAGLWLAWRARDWRLLLGVGVAVVISVALLFEMRQPIYQVGTAQFSLGYNNLTWPGTEAQPNPAFQWWWLCWPGARSLFQLFCRIFSQDTAMWAWHVTCICGFVLFQVVGLPLATAATLYIAKPSCWKRSPLLNTLVIWMVGFSILGSMVLNFKGESYSLAGQMLLHICWYLFPLLPLTLWLAHQHVCARMNWNKRTSLKIASGLLLVAMAYQSVRGPSSLEKLCGDMGFTLTGSEWEALRFVREKTPNEAVVLMPLRPQPGLEPDSQEAQQRVWLEVQNFAICGSIGGRATYIEYAHAPQDVERVREVIDLWRTSDPDEFTDRLRRTKATHLVEYLGYSPRCFVAGIPLCLESAWNNDQGMASVRIWKIKQAGSEKSIQNEQ